MRRRWEVASVLDDVGVISFRLSRAALCCEESCEAIFDMVPVHGSEAVVCPGCGGSSWVPLASIVPSLRVPPPRIRLAVQLRA